VVVAPAATPLVVVDSTVVVVASVVVVLAIVVVVGASVVEVSGCVVVGANVVVVAGTVVVVAWVDVVVGSVVVVVAPEVGVRGAVVVVSAEDVVVVEGRVGSVTEPVGVGRVPVSDGPSPLPPPHAASAIAATSPIAPAAARLVGPSNTRMCHLLRPIAAARALRTLHGGALSRGG
jgi:hypothetical protein